MQASHTATGIPSGGVARRCWSEVRVSASQPAEIESLGSPAMTTGACALVPGSAAALIAGSTRSMPTLTTQAGASSSTKIGTKSSSVSQICRR